MGVKSVTYISREAFKEEVLRLSTHYLNEWDTLGVLAAVDRIPNADVREDKKGRWVYRGQKVIDEEYPTYFCSVCKDIFPAEWVSECNFCPNCGARLE